MQSRNLIEVLVIEDNPGDASLVQEVLGDAKVLTHVHHVEDGAEALEFLRQEGEYAAAPTPQLIFLDLSLPGMDGRDLLGEIKSDSALRTIPVVVMTSSDTDQDVLKCHENHANCFVVKPQETENLAQTVRNVVRFWLEVVTLPRP